MASRRHRRDGSGASQAARANLALTLARRLAMAELCGADGSEGGPRYALVMSGGGARGAYEAGVLSYVLDELPRRLGRPVRFHIVTGTSVGRRPRLLRRRDHGGPRRGQGAPRDLALARRVGRLPPRRHATWSTSRSASSASPAHAPPPPEENIPERLTGLLDTLPLEQLVRDRIPWEGLRHNVDVGDIEAVAIAATEIRSGKSIVWVDNRQRQVTRWARDPFVDRARPRARPAPCPRLGGDPVPLSGAAHRRVAISVTAGSA